MILIINNCIGYRNFLSVKEPRVQLINQSPKMTVADGTGWYISKEQYQIKLCTAEDWISEHIISTR